MGYVIGAPEAPGRARRARKYTISGFGIVYYGKNFGRVSNSLGGMIYTLFYAPRGMPDLSRNE